MVEFLKENAMFTVGGVVFLGLMIGMQHKPSAAPVTAINTNIPVATESQTTTSDAVQAANTPIVQPAPKTPETQTIPNRIRQYSDDNERE